MFSKCANTARVGWILVSKANDVSKQLGARKIFRDTPFLGNTWILKQMKCFFSFLFSFLFFFFYIQQKGIYPVSLLLRQNGKENKVFTPVWTRILQNFLAFLAAYKLEKSIADTHWILYEAYISHQFPC